MLSNAGSQACPETNAEAAKIEAFGILWWATVQEAMGRPVKDQHPVSWTYVRHRMAQIIDSKFNVEVREKSSELESVLSAAI